jgi:GNAT superfamily N-acetyltransferase
MQYKVIKDIPNHVKLQGKVILKLWPEFMLHDSVSNSNWLKLFDLFPKFQFSLVSNDKIIGVANTVPYFWDKAFEELPEEGWDWVLKKGINDKLNGIRANSLNGLQIAVNKEYQGKGISSVILKEMISIARDNGFKYVTIPVRPSQKSKYPLIPIDNYIKWERKDGLPYDPWLRVQVRNGGKIIKPCHKAMYIPGSIAEWEKWTNMKFFETGDYVIKGALNPVKINLEEDKGEYIEPNVWVVYKVN